MNVSSCSLCVGVIAPCKDAITFYADRAYRQHSDQKVNEPAGCPNLRQSVCAVVSWGLPAWCSPSALGLSALTACPFGFEGHLDPETDVSPFARSMSQA
jgi:hypothetical protein